MHETDQEDERWIRPPRRQWYWRALLTGLQVLMALISVATGVLFMVFALQSKDQPSMAGALFGAIFCVPMLSCFFLFSAYSAYHIWTDPWHGMNVVDLSNLSTDERILTRLLHHEWGSIRPTDQTDFLSFSHAKPEARDVALLERLIATYPSCFTFRIHRTLLFQETGRWDELMRQLEDLRTDPVAEKDPKVRAMVHGWILRCRLQGGDHVEVRRDIAVLRDLPCPMDQRLEILDSAVCVALMPGGERFVPLAREIIQEAQNWGALSVSMRGTLGSLWVVEGRYAEGKKTLLEVFQQSELESDLRIATRYLARACEALGELEEARRWVRAAELWITPTHLPQWHKTSPQS